MAPLSTPEKVHRTDPLDPISPSQSLGSGRMSPDGYISFSSSSPLKRGLNSDDCAAPINLSLRFLRRSSSFLRVADLGIEAQGTKSSTATLDSTEEESHPNYHHPACDPPPGVEHDPKEQWIALNDSDGLHAPIAPLAVERLADFGLMTSINDSMWCPDSKTERIIRDKAYPTWMRDTFKPGKVDLDLTDAADCSYENEVLLWTGCFKHGLYGADLPAIRAAGVVGMSAKALVELLVDSDRVKEYNKLSLGRTDLQVFQNDMLVEGPFGKSITKILKSESKPPMLRKTLVFVSLLHAKELIDGSGYLIVTRAVHHPNEQESGNSIQSEILIGVNLIRKVQGSENQCLMINVNHIRSPMVPTMIAKRIGVAAAVGYINDIRALC